MYFFLQVNTNRSIGADDFIRTDSRIGGNISCGIWDSHIPRVVSHRMFRALIGSNDQASQKQSVRILTRCWLCQTCSAKQNDHTQENPEAYCHTSKPQTIHPAFLQAASLQSRITFAAFPVSIAANPCS